MSHDCSLLQTLVPRDFVPYVAGGRGTGLSPDVSGRHWIESHRNGDIGLAGWLSLSRHTPMHLILWFSAFGNILPDIPLGRSYETGSTVLPFDREPSSTVMRRLLASKKLVRKRRGETTLPGVSNSTSNQGFRVKSLIWLSKITELGFARPTKSARFTWRGHFGDCRRGTLRACATI
jgi:hypothetical protein